MKNYMLKHGLTIIGLVVGACAGYLYYHFAGCASGTCIITSKPINSTLYGAIMGGLIFSSFKKEKINSTEKNKTMSNTKKTIVDVRTPSEFMGGHVPGSINIPLQEIQQRLEEIKALPQPVITCCASGMRSASAKSMLKSSGFTEVYNGGGWMSLNSKLN